MEISELLKVGQLVVVANKLVTRRVPGWNSSAEWHPARVGSVLSKSDDLWLVGVIGAGLNFGIGIAEINSGEVQLCVEGIDAIRAAQEANSARRPTAG